VFCSRLQHTVPQDYAQSAYSTVAACTLGALSSPADMRLYLVLEKIAAVSQQVELLRQCHQL